MPVPNEPFALMFSRADSIDVGSRSFCRHRVPAITPDLEGRPKAGSAVFNVPSYRPNG